MAKKPGKKEPQKVSMSEINIYEAVQRWTKEKLLLDSGFYAGRLPSKGDLSFEMLQEIYQGILQEVGQEEAANFVRFVNLLTDMSASAFIVAFQIFWHGACRNVRVAQERSHRYDLGNARGSSLEAKSFALLGAAFSQSAVSEEDIVNLSRPIKGRFLLCYGGLIPEEERSLVVVTR